MKVFEIYPLAKPPEGNFEHYASLLMQEKDLRAWVVMPNHVHLLFEVQEVPISELIDAWKGFTAKEANKRLGRKGQFWQDGYWDTYMRDEAHELKTKRYIENNPVKAHLAAVAKEWPWSSARFRDTYERLVLPDRPRSAAVPGRSKVKWSDGAEQFQSLSNSNIAAAGDGRTPGNSRHRHS